jgi:two-component system, OmpR family, aerobic respiration control sensor histidine kinase ArcB
MKSQEDVSCPAKPFRVLLVEDNDLAAKIASSLLSDLECAVDLAKDGLSAVEYVKKNHYDIIFMDIGLPKLGGKSATQHVRERERLYDVERTPIVALTAHIDAEDKKKCIDAGMDAVLSKPLIKEEAEAILSTFIAHDQRLSQSKLTKKEDSFLSDQIIDMELAKKTLNGDEQLVWDMLTMLVAKFPEEFSHLELAYQRNDWPGIQKIAHKINGGASYCGTARLRQAASRLEEVVRLDRKKEFSHCYQQLVTEMKAVQSEVANRK